MICFNQLTNRLKMLNRIDSDELYNRFNSNNGNDFNWSYVTYNVGDPLDFNDKDMILIFDDDNLVFELNPNKRDIISQFKIGGSYWGNNTRKLLEGTSYDE